MRSGNVSYAAMFNPVLQINFLVDLLIIETGAFNLEILELQDFSVTQQ